MILDVNKIQEGECLAWVLSPVPTLAVWTSFNKAVKTKKLKQIVIHTSDTPELRLLRPKGFMLLRKKAIYNLRLLVIFT
jgi:hypothetical protein